MALLIGASMSETVLPTYKTRLVGNDIMRIFPDRKETIGGVSIKVPPAWSDSRLVYCKDNNVIPFVSSKGNGTDAFVAWIRDYLVNMPSWVKVLYYCDWHEPEADYGAGSQAGRDKYKAHQLKLWTMINALPSAIRAKVKFGPVLTKQWTEDEQKGDFNYGLYDPGPDIGDFFGIDSYVLSNTGGSVVNNSTLPAPVAFLEHIKGYTNTSKPGVSDTRPRIFPELGLIGFPSDTSGTVRANWLQGVHNEVKTWKVGQSGWSKPWSFAGWLWWNTSGKATGEVPTIGQARDFPLHLRSVPEPDKTYVDAQGKTHWISHPEDLPNQSGHSQPAPVVTFNAIWTTENSGVDPDPDPDPPPPPPPPPPVVTPSGKFLYVGATLRKEDISKYEPMLTRNAMMRVFPSSNSLPPSWTDPRLLYCQRHKTIPFLSSNIDGDSSKFAAMLAHLTNLPSWIMNDPDMFVYVTDRHEPENNFPNAPTTYLNNFKAWWNNVILKLPAAQRAKIKAGPILTRQWIEGGPTKGNNDYSQYDPMKTGYSIKTDFYAVDMYMDSWAPGTKSVATEYRDPATFLSKFKAYKYNSSDDRERIIAEFGAIGIPADTDGTMRAAWIRSCFAEFDTWSAAAQGWTLKGIIWWNNIGTSGDSLTPIGTARYFNLDLRQVTTAAPVVLPGNPPAPVVAYNQMALAHDGTTVNPNPDPEPEPDPDPEPEDPTPPPGPGGTPLPPVVLPGGLPVDLPDPARLLTASYTILVTDANLNVLGDPIHEWSSLQASVRWKEPGSGQITVPAYGYIREQLIPGCRIVVLRRLMGAQHILLAGPMERKLRERSDDGENGGVGKLTISFTEDLAWLGARLAYPDPTKYPEQQTTDYWTFTGDPEAAMLKLVYFQAGAGALFDRRVPKLATAAYSGVAPSGTVALGPASQVEPRERLEKLTDVLRKIATLGANPAGTTPHHPDSLGFRTRQTQVGGQDVILFEPLRSRNLSGEVHFSFARGNLKYYAYEEVAPSLTYPIVGGSGDGADRYVRGFPVTDPAQLAWGRFEGYVPRPGSEISATPKIGQDAANEALAERGLSARLASSAADTVDCRYGLHYDVGDIVSVELDAGEFEIAPVQTVNVQAWPTAGEVVGTTIGDQGARYDSAWIRKQREFDRRLDRLERR